MAEAVVGVRLQLIDPEQGLNEARAYLRELEESARAASAAVAIATKESARSVSAAVVTATKSAAENAKRTSKTATDHAKASFADMRAAYERANKDMAAADKRLRDQFIKYEKDKGQAVVAEITRVRKEKDKAADSERAAMHRNDKLAAEIHKRRKQEYQEQLRDLNKVALSKPGVQTQGLGVSAGLLGRGRNLISSLPGGGGMAGSILSASSGTMAAGAGIGAAVMVTKQLVDVAKRADDAVDRMGIAMQRSGLEGAKLARELDRTQASAGVIGEKFAMSRLEVMNLQSTIVGFSGITGKTLDRLTEISIGTAEALNMDAEAVARMIAKGADEDQQAKLAKLGVVFEENATAADRLASMESSLGRFVKATADSTQDAFGKWDRLTNRMEDLAIRVAPMVTSALGALVDVIEGGANALTRMGEGMQFMMSHMSGGLIKTVTENERARFDEIKASNIAKFDAMSPDMKAKYLAKYGDPRKETYEGARERGGAFIPKPPPPPVEVPWVNSLVNTLQRGETAAREGAADAKVVKVDARTQYTDEQLRNVQIVIDAATRYGFPVNVALAQIRQESGFNAKAKGPATKYGTALGMAQFLPGTGAQYGLKGDDFFDPTKAADAYIRHMMDLANRNKGSISEALGEYHAGPNRKIWGKKTRHYQRTIGASAESDHIRDLMKGDGLGTIKQTMANRDAADSAFELASELQHVREELAFSARRARLAEDAEFNEAMTGERANSVEQLNRVRARKGLPLVGGPQAQYDAARASAPSGQYGPEITPEIQKDLDTINEAQQRSLDQRNAMYEIANQALQDSFNKLFGFIGDGFRSLWEESSPVIKGILDMALSIVMNIVSGGVSGAITDLLFSEGGYTGNVDPKKPAGIVHGGEVVIDAATVDKVGVEQVMAIYELLKRGGIKGFAGGGVVGDANASRFNIYVDKGRGYRDGIQPSHYFNPQRTSMRTSGGGAQGVTVEAKEDGFTSMRGCICGRNADGLIVTNPRCPVHGRDMAWRERYTEYGAFGTAPTLGDSLGDLPLDPRGTNRFNLYVDQQTNRTDRAVGRAITRAVNRLAFSATLSGSDIKIALARTDRDDANESL